MYTFCCTTYKIRIPSFESVLRLFNASVDLKKHPLQYFTPLITSIRCRPDAHCRYVRLSMDRKYFSTTAPKRSSLFSLLALPFVLCFPGPLHRLKLVIFSQAFVNLEARTPLYRSIHHTIRIPFSAMSLKIQAAALLGALATTVSAHRHVSGIVADGTYYQGYDPSFQYQATPPSVVGWSCPQCLDNGFVDPKMYTDDTKIACHKDATAGQTVAKVAAGGTAELQWTTCESKSQFKVPSWVEIMLIINRGLILRKDQSSITWLRPMMLLLRRWTACLSSRLTTMVSTGPNGPQQNSSQATTPGLSPYPPVLPRASTFCVTRSLLCILWARRTAYRITPCALTSRSPGVDLRLRLTLRRVNFTGLPTRASWSTSTPI